MHVEGEKVRLMKNGGAKWFPNKLPEIAELGRRCEMLLYGAAAGKFIIDAGSFGWGYEAARRKWSAISALTLFREHLPGGDRFSSLLGFACFADETIPPEPELTE